MAGKLALVLLKHMLIGAMIGAIGALILAEGSLDGAMMGAIVGGLVGASIGARMDMRSAQVAREGVHPESPMRGRSTAPASKRIIQEPYRGPLSCAAHGESLSEVENLATEMSGLPAQVKRDDDERLKP